MKRDRLPQVLGLFNYRMTAHCFIFIDLRYGRITDLGRSTGATIFEILGALSGVDLSTLQAPLVLNARGNGGGLVNHELAPGLRNRRRLDHPLRPVQSTLNTFGIDTVADAEPLPRVCSNSHN